MEDVIKKMFERYESGKVNRRQLIQGLTVLALGGGVAQAAALPNVAVNHLSIHVKDKDKTRDFYRKALGLQVRKEDKDLTQISFGKSYLVIRNGNDAPKVDHFCLGFDKFDPKAIETDLKTRGFADAKAGADGSVFVTDPDGYRVQLTSNDAKP